MTVRSAQPLRRVAAAAPVLLAALTVLAGCGQAGPQVVTFTAGDRAALSTCADAVAVVDQALTTVRSAQAGAEGAAAASAQLSVAGESLHAIAGRATDSLTAQSVQDMLDSITAYQAVLPNRSLDAYQDAATDVRGRLAGFRNVCPVGNSDFASGARGWAATSPATRLASANGRHGGAGLLLTNAGARTADIGVTDAPNWVHRTWRGGYRAGLWARAGSGSPTLSLVVQEQQGGRVLGSAGASVQLGPDWTFLGIRYHAKGRGAHLNLSVHAKHVGPLAGVSLDDLAIARG